MEHMYNSLSKEQLVERLIEVEKEKKYLVELMTLKDKEIKELKLGYGQLTHQTPQSIPSKEPAKDAIEPMLWDTAFSQEFF